MSRANEPTYPGEIEVASADPLTLRPVQTGPRSYKSPGLTIREHFAGLAMQGLLACPDGACFPTYDESMRHYASRAVAYADALIAELERAK